MKDRKVQFFKYGKIIFRAQLLLLSILLPRKKSMSYPIFAERFFLVKLCSLLLNAGTLLPKSKIGSTNFGS